MLFEPGFEQVVFDRHAAEDVAVGERPAIVAVVGLGEDAADLEPTPRANDHATMARIANRVNRRKATDLSHRADAN
jgi:hypothetical protein